MDIEEDVKAGVVDVCVDMQERFWDGREIRREISATETPTSRLELINTFKKLLGAQRNDVMERKLRYEQWSRENFIYGGASRRHATGVALQPKLKQATIEIDAS